MLSTTVNAILSSFPPYGQAPALLQAAVLTVVAGNAQNFLSWSSLLNATSYTVKRGTSAGVHPTTVYSGSNLSVADTGLTNGTTYYYVVQATYSTGTSESPEVSSAPVNATHPWEISGIQFAYEIDRTGLIFNDSGKTTAVSGNGQAVGYITDIANLNHAVQATLANQPSYTSNAFSGFGGITGSGTAKYLTTGLTTSNANGTVLAVFKTNNTQMAFLSDTVNPAYQGLWFGIDGNAMAPTIYVGDQVHESTVQGMTAIDNTPAIAMATTQNGYSTVGLNGSFGASMAQNPALDGTLYSGNVSPMLGSTSYRGFNGGWLVAIYRWSRCLTTSELQTVQSYASTRYGVSIISTVYSNVAGTTDQVQAAATNTWITNSGSNTSAEAIFPAHNNRIRQSGTIARLGIKIASLTGITKFQLKIWRKSGTNSYDVIGTSEDLTSKLPAATKTAWITLGTPITGVQEGDMLGYRVEWSGGASIYNFYSAASGGFNSYYVFNASPSSTGYTWESQTSTTNYHPLVVQMVQPYLDAIGDSLTPGHPDNYSFIEGTDTNSLSTTWESVWSGLAGGKTWQNLGYGDQNSNDLVARFGSGIIDIRASNYVHLLIGVNDISQGVITQSTYIANMTTLINAIVSTGAIPVVSKIWPWTSGTNTQMQTRDAWNAALTTLVASYPTAILLDASSTLGQFRSGGDAGNLWDLKTAYNADGTHINSTGRSAYANFLYNSGVV